MATGGTWTNEARVNAGPYFFSLSKYPFLFHSQSPFLNLLENICENFWMKVDAFNSNVYISRKEVKNKLEKIEENFILYFSCIYGCVGCQEGGGGRGAMLMAKVECI